MSLDRVLCVLTFASLTLAQNPTAPAAEHRYVISIGNESARIASGTLWLYSYSWYGLLQHKVSAITNGVASVPLEADRIKQQHDPHPNTDAYLWVVQLGEHQWYRSPDISPEHFWNDLPASLALLGKSSPLQRGETQLVLPPFSKRRLTLLYPDGRPKAHTAVILSVYVSNHNHCAAHQGLPLGSFQTDENGVIELVSQHVPLFLDSMSFYEEEGSGPAGIAYSINSGLKTSADEAVVLKKLWELPADCCGAAELRVLTTSGRPRPAVNIYLNWSTNTCGGHDRVAETNANGRVILSVDPTVTALTLMIGGPYPGDDPRAEKNRRDLTDAELRELFSKRKLTIRW